MRLSPLPLAALLAAALAGCDALALDDEPFTEVDPTPAAFTVDLAEADTVGLWGTAAVAFQYEGRPVGSVEVFLGDRLVAEREGPGPVEIETAGLADGPYPLRVRARASSGTGSLADKLGRETVVSEAERVAVVDNAPVEPVDGLTTTVEDGLLALRWERYGRYNFESYTVRQRTRRHGAWQTRRQTDGRDQTVWADPTYLGGPTTYQVVLRARGEAVGIDPLEVSYPTPRLVEAVREGEGQARIAWTASLFPGAFQRYVLARSGRYGTGEVVRETDAVDDTVAVVPADDVFGQPARYTLTTEGRSGAEVESELDVYLDPASPFVHGHGGVPVVGVPSQDAVLGLDAETGQPALFDAATLERRAVADLPSVQDLRALVASPSGRIAALAGHFWPSVAYELDPATLAVLHRLDLGRVTVGKVARDLPSRVLMTDDGVLVLGFEPDFEPGETFPFLLAVDLESGEVVGRFDQDEGDGAPRWPAAASGDGRYLVAGDRNTYVLYERDADDPSGYRRAAALPESVVDARFLGPDRLAVLAYGPGGFERQARVFAVPSLEPVRDLGPPVGGGALRVDRASGSVLVVDGGAGRVRVYDAASGSKVADFDAVVDAGRFPFAEPDLALAGGAVWNRGRYRRLP
jgi:hypothetical protein